MDKNSIVENYKLYWLENGQKPASVYFFCKTYQYEEAAFYNLFPSLEAIEKEVWLSIFNATKSQLENDSTYQNYSAKEKLLAFYFLWVQKLKENRSYLLLHKKTFLYGELTNDTLSSFRSAFVEYIGTLIKQGYDTREVKERKFISDKYAHGFWLQALFVLKYWMDDTSSNFELTDAAIEKAVDLSFKLIGDSSLDSLIDFGKFILQKK